MKDKLCTRCDEEWPADEEFFRLHSNRPGFLSWCRACEAEENARKRNGGKPLMPPHAPPVSDIFALGRDYAINFDSPAARATLERETE